MDQDLAKRMLEGTESGMERIDQKNEDAREAILQKECPHCTSPLLPKLPGDITKVFAGTSISYEAWCPNCNVVVKP